MTRILRQSTEIVVRIGPFVDVTDGKTPETGIDLATADEAEALRAATATLDISGATWAAVTGADGWYSLTLTTTATNTIGELIIVVQDDSVCLPVWNSFQVIEEAAYDAIYATSAAPATAAALAVVDGIVDDILVDTGTTLQNELDGIQADTEDIQTRIGTPSDLGSGATVAGNLVDIEGQTDDIGAAGAGLTAINLPNQTMDIIGNITGSLSGSVGSVTDGVTVTTNNDKAGYSLTADFRIKKNTELLAFTFMMTDSTSHLPATGLTVTGQVSKDGGAFGALTNSVTEVGSGFYKVDLAATDVNADVVALKFTATGGDQLGVTIVTQTE